MRTIHLSAILVGLARHAGVDMADVLAPLRERFWLHGGRLGAFRSAAEPPSLAGSMKTDAERIGMPSGLPYVAGTASDRVTWITGAKLSDGALWYGYGAEGKIVVRDAPLPDTMRTGLKRMRGRDVSELLGHPALEGLGIETLGADVNDGHLTVRTTSPMIEFDNPFADYDAPMGA